jgi:hypothetical protein
VTSTLTTRLKLRPYLQCLPGLGLKFCLSPATAHSYHDVKNDTLARLTHSLELAFFFAGRSGSDDYNPRMYTPTNWTPHHWEIGPQLHTRLDKFELELKKLFKPRPARPNLLPIQSRVLSDLKSQQDFLIVPTDKNLVPSIIEKEEYIRTAMRDYLNVTANYKVLGNLHQVQATHHLKVSIVQWLKVHKDSISKSERKHIKQHLTNNKSPFGRFYLHMKVHKKKPNELIPSRPIASCPSSLLYPIGVFIDDKLKVVAH